MNTKSLFIALVFSALASVPALADGSQCSDAAADAAGYAARAHLGRDGGRVFVRVGDPVQVRIDDGQPWTSYEVETQLPTEEPVSYLVRVNARTCQVLQVAVTE